MSQSTGYTDANKDPNSDPKHGLLFFQCLQQAEEFILKISFYFLKPSQGSRKKSSSHSGQATRGGGGKGRANKKKELFLKL